MRRRITKALLATAAAGATIVGLGFVGGPAGAAQTTSVLTTNAAGWAAGNVLAPAITKTTSTWRFRYSSGSTVLPDVSAANPPLDTNAAQETFSVQLSNLKATFAAQMLQVAGAWNVQFVQYYQNGTAANDVTTGACNPASNPWTVGTLVRLDVYYSQAAGTVTFTAYSGPDQVCSVTTPAWDANTLGGGAFTEAYTGGLFSPAVVGPPATLQGDPYVSATASFTRVSPADARLFPVSGVHFTSYNGTMGTVSDGWDYQMLAFGTSMANTLADAPVLWNGDQNFGVWLRA